MTSDAHDPQICSPATDGPDAPGLADCERTVKSPGDLTPAERVELNRLRTIVYGLEVQSRLAASYIHDLDYAGAARILASAPKPPRPKRKIQSRGFDKGHRPLRSRSSFERRAP